MSTPLSAFHATLRSLLGDRQANGAWNYPASTLDAALRGVFATGQAPAGYALHDADNAAVDAAGLATATQISPPVALGKDFAMLCWRAAMGLVCGEDGQGRIVTRAMSIADGGDRKRDLLIQLDLWIRESQIDELFDTAQRFVQWATAGVQAKDYPTVTVVTPQQYDVTI